MKDYLKELCTNMNIELIYTDDDHTALSAGTEGRKSFIEANKVFSGCPEKVAKSIVDYYIDSGDRSNHLKVIKNFILDNIVTVEYTIKPLDEKLKGIFAKHTDKEASTEVKTAAVKKPKKKTSESKTAKDRTAKISMSTSSTSSLVELDISSMTKKSFFGKASKVNPSETIKVSSDDVVELEIEVDDSKL